MSTRAKWWFLGCAAAIAVGVVVVGVVGLAIVSLRPRTLAEERAELESTVHLDLHGPPPVLPPEELFERVRYPAPLGENWAYVSPSRGHGRAGVIYVHGGFDWSIDASAWALAPRGDDQSGRGFWHEEIALMLPSFRGNHDNPGAAECFYGEVDDLIAAADFLASRPDVDPNRIYLVGHSTGATLALLAAEVSDRFRGVFAIGASSSAAGYGDAGCLPAGTPAEGVVLRSPIEFIEHTRSRTFIIAGGSPPSNADLLPLFARYRGTAPVEIVAVPNLTHFSVLAPATEVIAEAIVDDRGPQITLAIRAEQIVEMAGERCGESRLEGSGSAEPAPWASRRPDEWPQIVLTNDAAFVGRTPLSGASAFLLETEDGPVVATAKHLTGWAGGVEPPVDDAALALPSRFARQLEHWRVFPRTQPDARAVIGGLAEPAIFGDWLLLAVRTQPPAESVSAVRLASAPVAISDRVFLVGCPYSEPDCKQNVYRGRVTRRGEGRFWYELDPPVDVRGFSGAPILNEAGRVVGIFSVSEDLERTADGLYSKGEADDGFVRHAAACATVAAR